jgi:hypothetical protein
MFVSPDKVPDIGHKLTRDAAERVAANWWRLLLNGLLLIVAGVLIFSIDWSVRSLSTFIRYADAAELIMLPAANPRHVQPTDFDHGDRLIRGALEAARRSLSEPVVSLQLAA